MSVSFCHMTKFVNRNDDSLVSRGKYRLYRVVFALEKNIRCVSHHILTK